MLTISKQQKGFTLVELIVVIVILGILSAVAAPKFFEVDTYRERGFKDELVAALRYAQKRAVASGCDVRVEIGSTDFTLYRHAGITTCGSVPAVTQIVSHPAGGDFTSQAPLTLTAITVVFDALGGARDSSYSVSDFSNVAGLNITIAGETGCVTQ